MPDPHSNFGYSTVATAPSPAASGTSLVVQAADGAKFPTGGSFNATIWPVSAQPTTANAEIVRITAISTDTFTITRAQESTSARTIVVGDQIAATVTAKTLTDVELDSSYLTSADQSVPANTQAIYDDYLELAASFVYELASGAELIVGDFATPLLLPDQNTNIFISVADETIPRNSEVIFSSEYEVSAPFATEVSGGGLLQVGTSPDIVGPFLPGYEIGYDQITTSVNITSITEAAGTVVISCAPHFFDGAPVLAEFFTGFLKPPNLANGDSMTVCLFEGATEITELSFMRGGGAAAAVYGFTVDAKYRFTPTLGWHTYTVTAFVNTNNNAQIAGGTGVGAATNPTFMRFTKV